MRRGATTFLLLITCLSGADWLPKVRAEETYQIVVYIQNPPDGALDAIDADAANLLDKFTKTEPNFETCSAGDKFESNNWHNLLRGRDLQAGGQCPPKCANSNSAYCRSIGCAKCGDGCSRRRELWGSISSNRKNKIKRDMNKELLSFCQGFKNCTITSEILYIKPDGSTVPA